MSKDIFDTFFGQNNKTTEKDDSRVKDWSEDWLRMKEANALSFGQDKLTDPYSQNAAVYRSIRSIAENLPQAIFKIYQGETQVPITHPLQMLFNKPNEFMSRWELFESIATYLNFRGEAFIYLNTSVGQLAGTSTIPAELWSLNPSLIKHSLDNGKIQGWIFNDKLVIEPKEMIHIKLMNPSNPLRGLSPISSIVNEMESDNSAAVYNKQFFQNGANPDGVVEVAESKEVTIDELRKLKRLWNENHQGSENSHKTAFLMGGMSYKNMGISQKDMDYIQGRQFNREQIFSVFGVPKYVAMGGGDKGEVNRSTANSSKSMFWSTTIKPQLKRIEEKLFVDFFDVYAPGFYGKFDLSNIQELKIDVNDALEAGLKMRDLGYTTNEINAKLDLQMPVDTELDIRRMPMNLVEIGDSSDAVPAKSIETKPDNSKVVNELAKKVLDNVTKQRRRNHLRVQGVMEKLLQSKLKRYIFKIRQGSLKIINEERPEYVLDKLEKLIENSKDKLQKLVTPVFKKIAESGIEQALTTLGLERTLHGIEHKQRDDLEDIVNEVVLVNRANKITQISDTIFGQLKESLAEGINEGEAIEVLAQRAKSIYTLSSDRAIKIARTESNSILNGSATEVYKREGVSMKEWITTTDGEQRESHDDINGDIVGIDGEFANGLKYPGDPSGPPEEVINCRCAISPVIR